MSVSPPSAYFGQPQRQQLLRDEAQTWLRPQTPFRKHSLAKGIGGGTDCVGLCESLLKAAGAVPAELTFLRRDRDYSPHVANDRILTALRGLDYFSEIPAEEIHAYEDLLPGDLLVTKTGVDLAHLLIVIEPPRCLQCAHPHGVSECDAFDPQYNSLLVAAFRPIDRNI